VERASLIPLPSRMMVDMLRSRVVREGKNILESPSAKAGRLRGGGDVMHSKQLVRCCEER
jgi:hypothetical protein